MKGLAAVLLTVATVIALTTQNFHGAVVNIFGVVFSSGIYFALVCIENAIENLAEKK